MNTFKKTVVYSLIAVSLLLVSYVSVCVLWCGSTITETAVFLWRFAEQPESMGAVAPSSRHLAEALSEYVQPGTVLEPRRFLEVGPGTGAVTQEIVKHVGPADCLDVVELDGELAQMLREKYAGEPRVCVHHCSIVDWKPSYAYDAVVVGVPFNALPHSLVQEIWEHLKTLSKTGATTAYFSYWGLPEVKKALLSKEERRDFKKIQKYLKALYHAHGTGKKKIWPNVPPAVVRYLRF